MPYNQMGVTEFMDPDDMDWGRSYVSVPNKVNKPFEDYIEDFEPSYTSLPQPDDPEAFALLNELRVWWTDQARADADLVVEKYKEYGNTALLEVGQQLADLTGREVSKQEAQMLGIWFFMMGKMSRWKTALLKGEMPSKDTLDDLAVYAFMARRVNEVGGWPTA